MTPRQIAMQAEADQAREQMADNLVALQKGQPAFLVAVYAAIEAEAGLAALPAGSQVLMPVLTFTLIAQLATIGLADIDGLLRRRKEDE